MKKTSLLGETLMVTAVTEFTLKRWPDQQDKSLRAWDAADEYLLQHCIEQDHQPDTGRLLIVNDSFGALSVNLWRHQPLNWSDSWLAHNACQQNLRLNAIDHQHVECIDSLSLPSQPIDVVLIKIPKTLALLEDQLYRLRPWLHTNSQILFAGMVRYLPASLWKLIERIIGPTQTSLARKKARVIQAFLNSDLQPGDSPYPQCWKLEGSHLILCNHANVFSREKLDIGSRLMLQHLPQRQEALDVVDLGCGNGVLGLCFAKDNEGSRLHFVDESYMAAASAKQNYQQLENRSGSAEFHCADGLKSFDDDSMDLVLCNPPFHQQQAISDAAALSMFRDSVRVLRVTGELWVIGNRHLQYHQKLKRYFKRVEVVASDRKFVILRAALT